MKQFMIAFMMMLAVSISMMGQASPKKATVLKDTSASVTVQTSVGDSAKFDTLSQADINDLRSLKSEFDGFDSDSPSKEESVIAIIAIVGSFSMAVLIIFLHLWYKNKNKQAQYRLAEKALESGKDIPEGLFKDAKGMTDLNAKGIKNTFLGIGLGIFLWALTGEFGLGCIGFMIMFMGIGQIIIGRTQKPLENNKPEQKSEEE